MPSQEVCCEKALDSMMKKAGIDASLHSFHSFRIMLACLGASPERIKGMLRRLSDDSLRIYARDNRHVYAAWLDKAMKADVTSVQAANLPATSDNQTWQSIRSWLSGQEQAGHEEQDLD